MAGLKAVIYKDGDDMFWSIASKDRDMWEEGPFETVDKAVDSYCRRTKIMNSIEKPEGSREARTQCGEGRWIAFDTTSEFQHTQREIMLGNVVNTLMFLRPEHAHKPYPPLIQFHWDEKFQGASHEAKEEVKAMNTKTGTSFFRGVFYRGDKWVFEVEYDPYVFVSDPYDSMFIAWIERELILVHLGLQGKMSDMRKTAYKERANMRKLYDSFSVGSEDPGDYFSTLHTNGDQRVRLRSSS